MVRFLILVNYCTPLFNTYPVSNTVTFLDPTPTERRVLILVSQDYSCKEITGQLGICLETVKKHCSNIIRKLGVSGKTAFRRAIRQLEREGSIPFTQQLPPKYPQNYP